MVICMKKEKKPSKIDKNVKKSFSLLVKLSLLCMLFIRLGIYNLTEQYDSTEEWTTYYSIDLKRYFAYMIVFTIIYGIIFVIKQRKLLDQIIESDVVRNNIMANISFLIIMIILHIFVSVIILAFIVLFSEAGLFGELIQGWATFEMLLYFILSYIILSVVYVIASIKLKANEQATLSGVQLEQRFPDAKKRVNTITSLAGTVLIMLIACSLYLSNADYKKYYEETKAKEEALHAEREKEWDEFLEEIEKFDLEEFLEEIHRID